ncbi:NADP-dependent phosphogluconate dehydrogenase [Maribacter hydrothermalis]|uniref:6-phosphogluconate dehydrogenase, decarboxylating n=1 Tax=Maribacter hydrothermalis TaxID=1836467 RepID=A0A1B7Z7P0_9FLAO|nr:NADP-dependent phosphogluconate dehydrogenase [Maribacter hydrothermalis]APQ15883.1 phosphogluconate dehydrogenase (NADP(+)-dependent, decarboxylating) [Maribacter hydrothermalis]OBR38738.1 phosphogluconate dehydrogenase (NADP(+)-dependent, decarboxylating) [Maribacter hydrothermalis]
MYDFGLIGLGVMGQNFILNVADNGFTAFGYDLDGEKVNSLKELGGDLEKVNASSNIKTFVKNLKQPRKIMLLVPAGKIVDSVIDSLLPHIDKGDIIIDGGNSFFTDTDRREAELQNRAINFFGAGVSGGAKGARRGPSIMPGGSKSAYEHIKPIFEAVSAKYKGEPCVAYLGPKSAGNYVKMVHNGIEYGLMQLTSEIYDVLKKGGEYSNDDLHNTFSNWNAGRLQSFLVEITSEIFEQEDELAKGRLVDQILDKAKQKGTGKWTSQNAMDLGIPVPSIDIAVSMRELSALKDERVKADALYDRPAVAHMDKKKLEELSEKALYFSFIITYAQGLHQLADASKEYGYDLDISVIAKIWRAGCIIRAGLLADITEAFKTEPTLPNLLLSPNFVNKIKETVGAARELVAFGVINGIPLPGLSNSLTYFDAYTSSKLPLNLIQAQRDYFGSHTYERLDRDGIFHTEWEK